MPVRREFEGAMTVHQLVWIADSIGGHVAAKLDAFGTDERTLTDELCDMFCIWASQPRHLPMVLGDPTIVIGDPVFQIRLTKTTQTEEAAVGADLEVRVSSPLGTKRAFIQAKVFDPEDMDLRCATSAGWDKLWAQLTLMRNRTAELSFLLVYVPSRLTDASPQAFSTWEQRFVNAGGTATNSRFGVTLFGVDDLLRSNGDWIYAPPVRHDGGGQFRPNGISFARLLLDLIACNRGRWEPDGRPNVFDHDGQPIGFQGSRKLSIDFANLKAADWEAVERTARALQQLT